MQDSVAQEWSSLVSLYICMDIVVNMLLQLLEEIEKVHFIFLSLLSKRTNEQSLSLFNLSLICIYTISLSLSYTHIYSLSLSLSLRYNTEGESS